MEITSHFIGLRVRSENLVNLFVSLKELFEKEKILEHIEFQNPLSTHITLYYLPQIVSNKQLDELKDFAKSLDIIKNITINKYDFFLKNQENYLCYLSTLDDSFFKQINKLARNKFQNNVVDNNYDFVPHITLFKIKNYFKYQNVHSKVLLVLDKHLKSICKTNIFDDIYIYKVNSKFKEQIQIYYQ